MEFCANYGDDDDESFVPTAKLSDENLSSAPNVALIARPVAQLAKYGQLQVMSNPKADVFLAPVNGPAHPFKFNVAPLGSKQAGMGTIEETSIEKWTFDEQYQTYQRSGYAMDVCTNEILGDINQYILQNGDTAQNAKGIYYV
jgi:pre-mRNA-processing factor 17